LFLQDVCKCRRTQNHESGNDNLPVLWCPDALVVLDLIYKRVVITVSWLMRVIKRETAFTLGAQLGFVGIIVEALPACQPGSLPALNCRAAQLVDALEACMSDGEHPQLHAHRR
jgi:hypothetical protein